MSNVTYSREILIGSNSATVSFQKTSEEGCDLSLQYTQDQYAGQNDFAVIAARPTIPWGFCVPSHVCISNAWRYDGFDDGYAIAGHPFEFEDDFLQYQNNVDLCAWLISFDFGESPPNFVSNAYVVVHCLPDYDTERVPCHADAVDEYPDLAPDPDEAMRFSTLPERKDRQLWINVLDQVSPWSGEKKLLIQIQPLPGGPVLRRYASSRHATIPGPRLYLW